MTLHDSRQQPTQPSAGYASRHAQAENYLEPPQAPQQIGAAPVFPQPYGVPGNPLATAAAPVFPQLYSVPGNSLPTAAALAPGVGGVVGFTLLFGVFGAISASNRAMKARLLGLPSAKYWVAFGVTLAAIWVLFTTLSLVFLMAIGGSTSNTSSSSGPRVMTETSLAQAIADDDDFTNNDGSPAHVDTVACTAGPSVDARGVGSYSCVAILLGAPSRTLDVTVGANGEWRISDFRFNA